LPTRIHHISKTWLAVLLACCLTLHAFADPGDTVRVSSVQDAAAYLRSIKMPDSSTLWPNVAPKYFMENLQMYIDNPLFAFDNKGTNFCSYTAISFVTFEKDPLGFIKFMLQLYREGKAQMGEAMFEPRKAVRIMAGKLKYKGMLDINPATQMWMLTLADHFKGYLNVFNKYYDEGDENRMWASTNFAKFNRMLRRLFLWKVKGRGADLVRPNIHHLYEYIHEKVQTGTVFLYLNNRMLYKKKHKVATRFGIPTHYVLVQSIDRDSSGLINIIYMDGGRKTHQQISDVLLRKIVFGVTYCTSKKDDDD
jgi:hypothetical protein